MQVDTQPFAPEDDIGVATIKLEQPVAQWPGPVRQQLLPTGIERLEIDRAIDLLDQIVLAGKIAVEQRLSDAEPACEIARPAAKALLRKKLGCLGDKLLAAIIRRKPLLLWTRAPGRDLLLHDGLSVLLRSPTVTKCP